MLDRGQCRLPSLPVRGLSLLRRVRKGSGRQPLRGVAQASRRLVESRRCDHKDTRREVTATLATEYLWHTFPIYGAKLQTPGDCERMLYGLLQRCDGAVTDQAAGSTRILVSAVHRLHASKTLTALLQISAEPSADGRAQIAEAVCQRMGHSDALPVDYRVAMSHMAIQSTKAELLTFEHAGVALYPDRLPRRDRVLLLGELYSCLRRPTLPELRWIGLAGESIVVGEAIEEINASAITRMHEVAGCLEQIGHDCQFVTVNYPGRDIGGQFTVGPATDAILLHFLRATGKVSISDDGRFVTVPKGEALLLTFLSATLDDIWDVSIGMAKAVERLAKQKDTYIHRAHGTIRLDLQALPDISSYMELGRTPYDTDAIARAFVLRDLYQSLKVVGQPDINLWPGTRSIDLWVTWERALDLPLADLAGLFEQYRAMTGERVLRVI